MKTYINLSLATAVVALSSCSDVQHQGNQETIKTQSGDAKLVRLEVVGEKIIRVTIPETLDYTTVFDDIFRTYTKRYDLEQVKSTNMCFAPEF